jgi:hypothetical protein
MTVVDVVEYGADGPHPTRCRVGLVRMPDSGDLQLASQLGSQPLCILPPHSSARIIGTLRAGLISLGAST